jgi:hypothetical protein
LPSRPSARAGAARVAAVTAAFIRLMPWAPCQGACLHRAFLLLFMLRWTSTSGAEWTGAWARAGCLYRSAPGVGRHPSRQGRLRRLLQPSGGAEPSLPQDLSSGGPTGGRAPHRSRRYGSAVG